MSLPKRNRKVGYFRFPSNDLLQNCNSLVDRNQFIQHIQQLWETDDEFNRYEFPYVIRENERNTEIFCKEWGRGCRSHFLLAHKRTRKFQDSYHKILFGEKNHEKRFKRLRNKIKMEKLQVSDEPDAQELLQINREKEFLDKEAEVLKMLYEDMRQTQPSANSFCRIIRSRNLHRHRSMKDQIKENSINYHSQVLYPDLNVNYNHEISEPKLNSICTGYSTYNPTAQKSKTIIDKFLEGESPSSSDSEN